MSTTMERAMQQHEHLLGAWYPENDVMGVIDEPSERDALLADLRSSGVDGRDVLFVSGAEGAERLDASGRHCNLLGHLVRWLQGYLTEEGVLGREYEAAAVAGHAIVAVHADDAAEIGRVREVLARHRAHHVEHFGHWSTITRLSS